MNEIPVGKLNLPALHALGAALGRRNIEEILLAFYERMSQDLLIGFFFEGRDLREIALKQASFLAKAMGLETSYTGKAPAEAHEALAPILAGHFDRRIVILAEILKEAGLKPQDIGIWLQFEKTFRDAIVMREA